VKNLESGQRRKITLLLVAVVSVFFGAVYQSYRYEELSLKVVRQENTQISKLEENKRAIASIAVLSSPARIDALAKQQKDLVPGFPQNAIVVDPPGSMGKADPTGMYVSNGTGSGGKP
jgi:cell division protein FtsL